MKEFNDFLKVLSVMVLSKEGKDYSSVKDEIEPWAKSSAKFFEKTDFERYGGIYFDNYAESYINAIKGLIAGKDFSKIKNDVENIYQWLENNRKSKLWDKHIGLLKSQIDFMHNIRKILSPNGSDSSLKLLDKQINFLKEPNLSKCFSKEIENFEYKKELPIKFLGKTDEEIYNIISNLAKGFKENKNEPPFVDPQNVVKENNPGKFELWLAGRNYLQEKTKYIISSIVRTYGDSSITDVPTMTVSEIINMLKNKKGLWPYINPNLRPNDRIDDGLVVYTKSGKSLGRAIPYNAEIVYNTKYKEDYTDKFAEGKGGMYYLKMKTPASANWTNVTPIGRAKSNKKVTTEHIRNTSEDIEKYRKNWIAKLKSNDDEERMAATIIEIVYQTAIRIGSKVGSATDSSGQVQDTYGLTVLKRNNVKVQSNKVELSYIGKAAQAQTQYLLKGKDKYYDIAIENFKSYIKDKKPNDFIFTYVKDGKKIRFPARLVNEYLRNVFGLPRQITIHKFRHMKANKLAKPIIDSCELIGRPNLTDKDVLNWLNINMQPVGEELGHFKKGEVVGDTAIASYIDPSLVVSLFERCKVVIPKKIERLLLADS